MVNVTNGGFLGGIGDLTGFVGGSISSFIDFIISVLTFLLITFLNITAILIMLPYWTLLFLTHLPIFIVWTEGILTAMAYFKGKKTFYIMLHLWGHYNIILARGLIIGFSSFLKFTINTIIRVINMVMRFVFGSIEAIPFIQ